MTNADFVSRAVCLFLKMQQKSPWNETLLRIIKIGYRAIDS